MVKGYCFLLIGLLTLSSCNWEPPVDWHVRSYLQQSGFAFVTDPDGDFIVNVHLAGGRAQKVWIRSKTNHYQGTEIREIFAIAQEFAGEIPTSLLLTLMQDSYKNRLIGSWVVIKEVDRFLLAFLAKVQGKNTSGMLGASILEVAEVADRLELIKSGADRF